MRLTDRGKDDALLTRRKSLLECQGVFEDNFAVIGKLSERRYGCPDATVGVCWESW